MDFGVVRDEVLISKSLGRNWSLDLTLARGSGSRRCFIDLEAKCVFDLSDVVLDTTLELNLELGRGLAFGAVLADFCGRRASLIFVLASVVVLSQLLKGGVFVSIHVFEKLNVAKFGSSTSLSRRKRSMMSFVGVLEGQICVAQ